MDKYLYGYVNPFMIQLGGNLTRYYRLELLICEGMQGEYMTTTL